MKDDDPQTLPLIQRTPAASEPSTDELPPVYPSAEEPEPSTSTPAPPNSTVPSRPSQPGEEILDSRPSRTQSQPLSNGTGPRVDLINRARLFLLAPSVRNRDDAGKREFLLEKGLNAEEIDGLLAEVPNAPPPIPPRSYSMILQKQPPPPSNLPLFLISLCRAFAYVSAASGVVLFAYFKYILPRLSEAFQARRDLRTQQIDLLIRLNERLTVLRDEVKAPSPAEADPEAQVEANGEEQKQGDNEEEVATKSVPPSPTYTALVHLISVLPSLHRVTSTPIATTPTPASTSSTPTYATTLHALTQLTAYISSQTYLFSSSSSSYSPWNVSGFGNRQLGPAEEEVRREIKALKGLVLNRRSFAPTSVMPSRLPVSSSSTTSTITTPVPES
ncbi:hypothetical protein BOTBODRAFT_64259 [Botryobasidium botryosum FD-172 SS1]|uniref:Peroxisomal membrane protein PEX14 n=1 Tax=Botryobasidium botryosum (strain FD-172 SS1) TaxID=930990 RepID=A0A067MZA7_BOTB1|nr:hypothetical protein BOTBODRAFT_64259 [Botryobasidium botryosum FD-172 SS1]